MLYFESIIFDPEYEGSICTSHADISLRLPPLDIILTMKVVAPDKALMCSRPSSCWSFFRYFHDQVTWHSHMKTFLA